MTPFHHLCAFALLASPPDSLHLPQAARLYAPLAPALRAVALRLELLDPREVTYVLTDRDEFAENLKLLQERFGELHAAPPLAESKRFPGREQVGDLLAFNRLYRERLHHRLKVDRLHADELEEALRETDHLYRVWDLVRDACCEYYYVTYRRQALHRLREAVGAHAFYTGQLPPHVPLWRFQEIH